MKSLRSTLMRAIAAISPRIYCKVRFNKYRRDNWESLKRGSCREPECVWVRAFLDLPGDLIDIGANAGLYLHVFREFRPPEAVHAFEPLPQMHATLRNVFPKMNIQPMALSNRVGKTKIKIPEISGACFNTRATLNVEYREQAETNCTLIDVEMNTLDQWSSDHPLERVALVKIDAEGHEAQIIQGAERFLAKYRPMLLIEIEERHHQQGQTAELVSQICSKSYSGYFFHPEKKDLLQLEQPISELQADSHGSRGYVNNFLFLPNEKSECFARLHSARKKMNALD